MRGLCGFVMICLGVPWLPSLCATDYIYHPLYKVYSNDVVAIDVGAESQGWAIFFMAPIPKQVWLNTRHAQGSYPGGLALAIKHDHVVDPEPFLDCDYTVTSHTLTGTISAAAVKQTPVTTYTVTMHNHLETYINDSHGAEDNWVLQEVTDDQLTYNHHFYCDDFADGPADATHVGTLAVQTTWSANNGWLEGHLHAEESWDAWNHMPADVDVVRLDTGVGVYCVETTLAASGKSPLGIAVFKKQANNNAYDGDQIGWTNDFNVYNDQGQIDGLRQRVYFTLDNDNGAYVQLSLTNARAALDYKVRVFRARPVILVHGIECYPKTKEDLRHTPAWNSMGNWNDNLPWDGAMYPCVCYNFCWDSYTDQLKLEGESIIRKIVDSSNDEEHPNVKYLYTKHGNMACVLIGHSMGGFIVRYALHNASDKIYLAVTLGTPHYGSDVANMWISKIGAWVKQSSENNLKMLRRGSEFAWAMHDWGGKSKLICLAGYGAPARVKLNFWTWRFFERRYVRGLTYWSDGVVPVSSAFVEGAYCPEQILADHGTIALAAYVPLDRYPLSDSTPSMLSSLWAREYLGTDEKGQIRIPPAALFTSKCFNQVYLPVRDFIR